MDPPRKHEKIKLVEINSYLTCYLCKGYLIDATTISECLHSFCRSCIIKFLQENCYCPVCEVIINKAKPCLKLDKTLQDIVYKLVPGLFVNEMYRRKEFYQKRPLLALKVSPEERGEDTERTIFNPQDAISLSIEYTSDDSTPGAIPSLTNSTTIIKSGGNDEINDNPMKRYLQCPGMCRIEVLKKFVRNKYNVDTNLFHIDILYKRVPLPDHYTLIDIGYIYSWKRNEPMKFFFRITDINKVTERFDYFDGRVSPEIVVNKPTKPKVTKIEKKKEIVKENKVKEEDKQIVKLLKQEDKQIVIKKDLNINNSEIKKDEKSEIEGDKKEKLSVFTNLTLNRDDNIEIITKIENDTNKKEEIKVQKEVVPNDNNNTKTDDKEKENFLKLIELTAKSSLEKFEKKEKLSLPIVPSIAIPSGSGASSSTKRKNSSPMKNDKKSKMKIIIQPKTIQNPTVRQMVTNVNQTVNNVSKIVEQTTTKTDIRSIIDNCKINIPASLSITLNEGGENGTRTPPSIPPVKNYIEILKLPEKEKPSSFQKIFEESIKKETPKSKPLDLTNNTEGFNSNPKRKILEIATQLQKKTKIEQEKKTSPKIAIPKLERTLKPSPTTTTANLHSPSLGLNYTVSVNDTKKSPTPPSSSSKAKNGTNLNPNQILEKYNIQNLAQLTASFNYGALQHAMFLKQMEHHHHHHHNWLNQAPLLQYEKYLQSLSAQSKIMGNTIKEN